MAKINTTPSNESRSLFHSLRTATRVNQFISTTRLHRRYVLRAVPDPQDPSSYENEEGDPNVQDSLINMLKFEIGKKKVEEYVEESSDKLKSIADEAKEEMEKLAELNKLRGEIAFNSALADINKEADEFEEKLRKSREEMEAREKEFNSWEEGVASSRSEGQFFKTLYQSDKKKPVGESLDQLKERANKVKEPAKQEVNSPIRFYLFFTLAFLLAADVGADMASDQPSIGPDALYTGLAALAAWLATNERKVL